MQGLLKKIIESSIIELEQQQPNILNSTSQTTMTEWNLGHHFANVLSKYIFWLNNDLDVVKRNYNNKRPDIIFHKRGLNCLNTLVLELKINDNINDSDIVKIKEDWTQDPLSYKYGACISFSRYGRHIGKFLHNDEVIDLDLSQTPHFPASTNQTLKNEILQFVETISEENLNSKIDELTSKIRNYYGF